MATTSRSADLTSGPMLQKIILFSVPLAASSILQLLFNAADVVVVGRFAGSTALAAVGSNGALINLLVNLFVGLSLGANVVAARCFGARDEKGVQDTVHTAVALGLVSGVLLAVVGFCAARGLLELMLDGTDKMPGLRHMEGVTVQMDGKDLTTRDLILGIELANIPCEQAVKEYDKRGIVTFDRSASSLYSRRMLDAFGLKGVVRLSPLHVNSVEDIEEFLQITADMVKAAK